MKQQIIHISPLQTAKVFAILYFVISLPLIAIFSLQIMLSPESETPYPVFFFILLPFLYAIFGFIFTITGAWIYNRIARSFIGGLEYTTREVESNKE